jgi:hypothetical protein
MRFRPSEAEVNMSSGQIDLFRIVGVRNCCLCRLDRARAGQITRPPIDSYDQTPITKYGIF